MAHNYIQFTEVLKVKEIKRLCNSRNGNPRFRIRFSNGISGTTKTDAGWVYAIHNGMTTVTAKFHFTPTGRCVIDDMLEGSYILQERIKIYEKALKTFDPTTDKVWIDRYTNLINTLNQEINNA